MQIHLVAATSRQPSWLEVANAEYVKRLRAYAAVTVHDIPLAKRRRNASSQAYRDDEARRMLDLIPSAAHVVALAETGALWSTRDLVARLEDWRREGGRSYLLIGGPDGLGAAALERARDRWSVSKLTLPHGLCKLVVIEALYRAFTIAAGHPYHRA